MNSNGDDQKKMENEEPGTSSNGLTNGNDDNNPNKRKINDDDDDVSDSELDFKTIADMLQEDIEQVQTASGLLGGTDENNCTYIEDNVPRQPLYACNTCPMNIDPETGEKFLAGFCLACSNHCHKDHDLFELYSKRNFRCDCGNEKFKENKCKLFEKMGYNENNKYNHNFKGLYCTCERPYPCDDFEDEMFGCAMCEDWYHGTHLDVPPVKGYHDMICKKCVEANPFLVYYHDDGLFTFKECEDEETLTRELDQFCKDLDGKMSQSQISTKDYCKLNVLKRKYQEKYPDAKEIDKEKCKTMYLPLDWRLKLCQCSDCLKMYEDLDVTYVTNLRDMLSIYMHLNQKKEYDKQMSKMNRFQQIQILNGIETLKKQILDLITKCKKGGKVVVTTEDVTEFSEKLKNETAKRKKIGGGPYFCR